MNDIRFVPKDEMDRLLGLDVDRWTRAALVADACRINVLHSIRRAGSGHIGTSFSAVDIVTWLYLEELRALDGDLPNRPIFFSSKGHDAPATYAVLAAVGALPYDATHRLRRHGGLPGHPDVAVPWITTNTGSLGMGISKAKGMALADRRRGVRRDIVVLTGDGELQEGQIWESLGGAVNRGLGQLTVIVDANKIQSDTWVESVSPLGDLVAKFGAFGWRTARCDGHDLQAVSAALDELRADPDVPGVLVADTTKGRGVSRMEGVAEGEVLYRFHSGAPAFDVVARGVDEILARIDQRLAAAGSVALRLERETIDAPRPPQGQRLVNAYSDALLARVAADERIMVLDGDLALDTGTLPISERHPDRFVECGIAEQDMVSMAGGMALQGLVPIVHSFACFLSTRPDEQIFNNATEHTKILYVGSLAGIIPGGPGHSHQSVRDVATFGSVPGLLVVEPCHEAEVAVLLEFCLDRHSGPAYLRLVTPPVDVPYGPPAAPGAVGTGAELRAGSDVIVIGAGPIVLSSAWRAAEVLERDGPSVAVVDLPFLNQVDLDWLREAVGTRAVVVAENHTRHGGMGSVVLTALARLGLCSRAVHVAIDTVAACGTNDEVLAVHGLDVAGLTAAVRSVC